ncbi:MAG: hypothetical protein LBL63_06475 [Clostridiales Family XIII bacterium]|jgi:hypothetical protein|nr:hypothetical protein [Clostridiales Family XIII bacterium]
MTMNTASRTLKVLVDGRRPKRRFVADPGRSAGEEPDGLFGTVNPARPPPDCQVFPVERLKESLHFINTPYPVFSLFGNKAFGPVSKKFIHTPYLFYTQKTGISNIYF